MRLDEQLCGKSGNSELGSRSLQTNIIWHDIRKTYPE